MNIYPYTNFHDLNLDWILSKIHDLLHINISAESTEPGTEPTAEYDESTNTLSITIPKGEKGDKGDKGDRGATGTPGANGYNGTVVQTTEPSRNWDVLWIDPTNTTTFNMPEINDEVISHNDTYSSYYIEELITQLSNRITELENEVRRNG